MDWIVRSSVALRRFGRLVGPYLMLELLLPGGSLMALALFLYRQRPLGLASGGRTSWIASPLSSVLKLAALPLERHGPGRPDVRQV